MLGFGNSSKFKNTFKIYSFQGNRNIILIKNNNEVILRSGFIFIPKPIQISSLFPIVDLFSNPLKISLKINFFNISNTKYFNCAIFLDLDVSECLQGDFNEIINHSLNFHKQRSKLLEKNISLKDIEFSYLTKRELLKFMDGSRSFKKFRKYSYEITIKKEENLVQNMILSNNKIKKIDFKRQSIIPESKIPLGISLSNKPIGVNSHVLFLTGKKEFRIEVIKTILFHYSKLEDYHLVVIDFGLDLTLQKTFSRKFTFEDVLLDPFSFKDIFSSSDRSLFISHVSFISKNILRLNDRQITLLEDQLNNYFKEESHFTLTGFLNFLKNESSDELLENGAKMSSFTNDMSQTTDYTDMIKKADSNIKSNDLEALVYKFSFIETLLSQGARESFWNIFSKNHLDIFSINVSPDQKVLFFYLLNLFYSLNDKYYKNYKFMFLDLDSILFDNFREIESSWLHPDLKQSLFDSSEIFPVKKIFNILDTRIYCSHIQNAPYNILSKTAKENIDKLQFLNNYSLLESPSLQRQEFFKITFENESKDFDLPNNDIFKPLVKLLFSKKVDWTYKELYALYEISNSLLKKLLSKSYLRKRKSKFMLTEKATDIKKVIIDLLAYQPNLTIEENDFLISLTDTSTYNVFKKDDFPFTIDIDLMCTRLLANQFLDPSKLNIFLLYRYLQFKKKIINDNKLFYYLIVSIQMNPSSEFYQKPEILEPLASEEESLKNYFSEIEEALNESKKEKLSVSVTSENLVTLNEMPEDREKNLPNNKAYPSDIEEVVNRINKRIANSLPNSKLSFPENPIILIMKFLDQETCDLLFNDLSDLANITNSH